MDNDLAEMLAQLQKNPAMLQSLMRSRDAQALMQQLSAQGGAQLQNAANSAMRGDASGVRDIMSRILSTPDGAAMMERIANSIKK